MSWITNLFSKGAKDVGEAVKVAADGVGGLAVNIRTAITGDMPPGVVAKLEELALEADKLAADIMKGQQAIEVAAIEKGGFNAFFLGGWRPALGWISALAIFFYYIPPLITGLVFWILAMAESGALMPFPIAYNIAEIMGLVASLLGMSTLRTYEKQNDLTQIH